LPQEQPVQETGFEQPVSPEKGLYRLDLSVLILFAG
jgi:hypothetical protein